MTNGKTVLAVLFGAVLCAACFADVTTGPLADKGPDDVPGLIEALDDENMGTRRNAALVLGEIGDAAATPALIERVKNDNYPRVRRRAMDALGKIGAAEAVPALIEALKSEDNLERRDAARALGALGDGSAVPALIEALKDKEGFVRRDAARALGRIGDAAAVPPLQELAKEPGAKYSPDRPLGEHEDSPAARAALLALVEMGGETLVPALKQLLEYDLPHLRAHAITTAGSMGQRAADAASLIAEYLADDEICDPAKYGVRAGQLGAIVRLQAIEALQTIGGSEGVTGLSRAFELITPWDTWEVVSDLNSVAAALAELGDPAALPALRAALEAAEDEEKVAELHPRNRSRLVSSIRRAISELE